MDAADQQVPIAVVGMDCVLPGAPDPAAWAARVTPAVGPVPRDRWPGVLETGPAGAPDVTVAARGAFLDDLAFDPSDLDLGPIPPDDLDPLHALTLHVVRGALQGASVPRERTALLLANLALPGAAMARAVAGPVRERLKRAGRTLPWLREAPGWHRHHASIPALLAAAANGLEGGATSLDAACASGLYAVQLGCQRLAAGEVDAVVAAAVQRADLSYLLLGFSQLRALSPSATPLPLDARADGLVVGEGAAAVLLMRLEDAVARKHRVLAVIRGGSLGNDGRKGNMLAPDAEGQLRVLRQAWRRAGLGPQTVGYVECHATGTPLGDRIEAEALHRLLSDAGHDGPPVVLSSAKALIGHTITTAGLAGLLRAISALEGERPAGAARPIAALAGSPHLAASPEPSPWPDGPRRAGVSAFGFGGTNAHVVVEAWEGTSVAAVPRAPRREPLAVIGLSARLGPLEHEEVLAVLAAGETRIAPAPDGLGRGAPLPPGTYVEAVTLDPRRWRIPPVELADLLPQQLLVLETAADALEPLDVASATVASVLGMEVDGHVADAVLRAAVRPVDPALADAVAPPLTAGRVQGSLPNFVANRVASQLDLRGPSYTVSAGALSGLVALDHAARLLADEVDVVVVGAVDLPGHAGVARVSDAAALAEGAVVAVVTTVAEARRRGWTVLATVDVQLQQARHGTPVPEPAHRARVGHGGAMDGMLALLDALASGRGAVQLEEAHGARATARLGPGDLDILPELPARRSWDRVLHVPHGPDGALPPLPGWLGAWGGSRVPRPLPRSAPPIGLALAGPDGALVPLSWPGIRRAEPVAHRSPDAARRAAVAPAARQRSSSVSRPSSDLPSAPQRTALPARSPGHAPSAPSPVPARLGALLRQELEGLATLAAGLGRATDHLADAHARFLAHERRATEQLEALAASLHRVVVGGPVPRGTRADLAPSAPASRPAPAVNQPPASDPAPPAAPPPSSAASAPVPGRPLLDRQALEHHATGTLAEAFGPEWADLDRYEPRVRMPSGQLLLASRVLLIEGARGELGPARIVTEYDLPLGRDWSPDGRPPPCVVVESGQADLLLVSWLGIDAECRGQRIYRLLDCDLHFHGPRPDAGQTLRHDIRIDRFARFGATTLFYFRYDCVLADTGTPVLSMRDGCAGFFTPDELRTPRGVDARPADLPPRAPLTPLIAGAPTSLDDEAVRQLAAGRVSHAFGPAFAAADGATLALPPSDRWRLVHRVTRLASSGGPHGLGEVVYEQDLADDDWFNPIHFQGDPCMPGTLMFDGCTQAVQVWLLGLGVAAAWPDASFEPMTDRPARLRCRGQVAPGHRKLVYRARITDAGLDPAPWAVADVVLEVDGTPVVRAMDVGVRVVGPRRVPAVHGVHVDRPRFDLDRILEYSVGSAERALGAPYAPYDGGDLRCARMPGTPYLTMTRVVSVEGEPFVQAAPATVVIEWEVPDDSWYLRADPVGSVPFAILLEGALQPCGWLTAWQGAPIAGGRDRYFRNLGGSLTQYAEVPPGTALRTRSTQTAISSSGGMTVTVFTTDVFAGALHVLTCQTHFGYFSAAALDGQKGLLPPADEEARRADALRRGRVPPRPPLGAPGGDWALLDCIIAADASGGAWGRGFYAAETRVDPDAWFFVAHFHQDPVMPGSLGLEALLQLARHALLDQLGESSGRFRPVPLDHEVRWTYRGQVRQRVEGMTFELDVRGIERRESGVLLRADGLVRADGLPIYRFEDLAIELTELPPRSLRPPPPTRPPGITALIDRFAIEGDTGQGILRLDPALHPWLAQHCPTLTAPAVPMAFAAEIAAEAASLMRPGLKITGVPVLEAQRWIHTGDGPVDLLIVAVADGDRVAVTLAVHADNPRFPHLAGPRVHMRAVVTVGEAWPEAVAAPEVDVREPTDVRAYYDGGHTFHGPLLQAMTALATGADGAMATLEPADDARLLGDQPRFLLDPLLLDAATHPMWSSEPERWVADLAPGHLAYPVRADGLRFFGPRPSGPVRCSIQRVEGLPGTLAFDVHLASDAGPWCAYRWTEAIVRAGALLGQPAPIRRAMLWERTSVPDVRVGRPWEDGWEVVTGDLEEPLPGTTAGLLCAPIELAERRHAADPRAWDLARVAAKEAVRTWLQRRLGVDTHPRDLVLCAMRPDLYVVLEAPTLSARAYTDHLGPTRFDLVVASESSRARARVIPR